MTHTAWLVLQAATDSVLLTAPRHLRKKMHSTCQQAGSQAAAAAIALQPQHRSDYDCNQRLDQPVNASNVAMLQVTGKLDGADSGLDISVNELDQHLHKVLEVREPPDCLPAQQQSHMRPAMGCCVQPITCIDVCSRCLLNLVTSKGDSSAWVWSLVILCAVLLLGAARRVLAIVHID